MNEKIKIFFDGQCPLCSREIAFYKRQKGAELLEWIDIYNSSLSDYPDGLTPAKALKRFHVLGSDGKLESGGKGFVLLWLALPKFSFFGKAFNNSYMGWILECAYKTFVYFRPFMQRSFSFFLTCTGRRS
jgi:predicted DCC family thiol-disulfide oxidoreductase YuxK